MRAVSNNITLDLIWLSKKVSNFFVIFVFFRFSIFAAQQPTSAELLQRCFQRAWDEYDVKDFQKLVDSMPKRIQQVIDVGGAPIAY